MHKSVVGAQSGLEAVLSVSAVGCRADMDQCRVVKRKRWFIFEISRILGLI